MNKDLQYIKMLSIFYYVIGALIALVSCLALSYLFIGIMFVAAPPSVSGGGPPPPPPALGWAFIIISCGVMLLGWAWAVALMFAGWFLGRCRHYLYCLVLGCSTLLFQPLGTILGVFTIIILIRPNVKRLFEMGGQVDDEDGTDDMEDFDDQFHRDSYNIRR
jgi:hypothetical protein